MRKKTKGHEPANPSVYFSGFVNEKIAIENLGLTKREYFAALCLQGIISNFYGDTEPYLHKLMAEKAVVLADLLILQLNKTPENGPRNNTNE
mgnify:CR=1 FL=1